MRKVWIGIVILILAIVLYQLATMTMDFATSVVPGWHTTIYPPWLLGAIGISVVMMVFMIARLIRMMFRKPK